MLEAVKVALDPTPVQERLMLSHAGRPGSRTMRGSPTSRRPSKPAGSWNGHCMRCAAGGTRTRARWPWMRTGRRGGGRTARKPTTVVWRHCPTPCRTGRKAARANGRAAGSGSRDSRRRIGRRRGSRTRPAASASSGPIRRRSDCRASAACTAWRTSQDAWTGPGRCA